MLNAYVKLSSAADLISKIENGYETLKKRMRSGAKIKLTLLV